MKLIFALGNPEEQYEGTRHNVGFAVADDLAARHGQTFRAKPKFKADIVELNLDSEKVIIAKPATYYNLVGESLRSITDFYHLLPRDVLIVADDLALPVGTIRTRIGGSDAGNNGIKSINAHGGEQTNRLRIGTANSHIHTHGKSNFVLSKFGEIERSQLTKLQKDIDQTIADFIAGDFTPTTHSIAKKEGNEL
ncbi:aminoacyl-tRNA hydrolase [Candidatus Saccharibacteria bacterium]|nr:MAG: aminoacyl-tRNA hydrolase [Candidatus Saccharibacteria bacterium]